MLYVIKLGFEMINTKFFRIVDGNALRAQTYMPLGDQINEMFKILHLTLVKHWATLVLSAI